jgi:hypothetical protein
MDSSNFRRLNSLAQFSYPSRLSEALRPRGKPKKLHGCSAVPTAQGSWQMGKLAPQE